MGNFDRKDAPVSEGQVIQAKCEGKGSKGAGMFKVNGFVIFVEDTEEGKEYEVKVTKVLQKVGFGEVIQAIN